MPAGYVTDSDNEADQLDNTSDDDEIPGALQSANYRVYSTWELYERMIKKTIDVAPPYQRDVVWTKNSQSALIDSIFKNKWVPTLLFSERPATIGPDGTKIKARWVCMDGKQRLTSIKLFIDGEIPWYKKPKEPIYYKQSHPPHPSRRLLDEPLKDIFLGRGMTAAMYNQLTELQERDIFRLVQEGKPLSTGEKLQATAGPWGCYIAELTDRYMVNNPDNPNGWCQRISNLKRGADYHTMAQVVLMIRDIPIRAPEPPRNLTTLAIQRELDTLSKSTVPQEIKDHVQSILDIFMEISTLAPPRTQYTVELKTPEALHLPIQKGRKTMLAPVEMIWIPYMIYLYHSQLSKGKLLEMIERFKIDIRKRWFNEVKNNSKVILWILEWIIRFDVGGLKGKYAGWAVPRPAPQLVSQDNPASDASGIHAFAKRSLSVQTSAKRAAPSPNQSPTGPINPQLKRPRKSVQVTNSNLSIAPSSIAPSPNITSSQQHSMPIASSSVSRSATTKPANIAIPVANGNSQTQPVSTPQPMWTPQPMSTQPVSTPQRANSLMNGSQLSSTSSSNRRQPPTYPIQTRATLPTPNHRPVYPPSAGPLSQVAPTVTVRQVPNYSSQTTHPTSGYQRAASQHPMQYIPSASQPPNNANVNYRMNDRFLRQPSGYTRYYQ